jgi:tRNA (mo5U34)-methyltransferase
MTKSSFSPSEPDGFDFLPPHISEEKSKEIAVYSRIKRESLYLTAFWNETREKLIVLNKQLSSKKISQWSVDETSGLVVFNSTCDSMSSLMPLIDELIEILHPWRKGPFQICGKQIDAEWQSWMKWDRIKSFLPDLRGKVVADIGCNNGYYLFRLAALGAKLVWGCDPTDRFFFQYSFLQALAQESRIRFEPFGVEDCIFFPETFDLILCLGVLYHRRDPLGMLDDIKRSLKKGGHAIIESIVIPESYLQGNDGALFIKNRYQMMRNVYFIPSASMLAAWMQRVGFKSVEILDESITTIEEQRTTQNARFLSLKDTLMKDDPSKTIEGFPAPRRALIRGFV